MQEENMVIDLIESFPQNMVIILPQTLFFEANQLGMDELQRFQRVVLGHNALYICLRDKSSYELLVEDIHFSEERAFYCPDMSLYLECSSPKNRSENYLFCIRKDKESTINSETYQRLVQLISEAGYTIRYTSTVKEYDILLGKRETEV